MSSPQDQAYINIERAYGEGKFSEALRQAEALLPRLPTDRADGLAERLQLLMGHIHLYGLGAPERAASYYQTVHDASADPAYRQLAQQGLVLCQNAPTPEPVAMAEPLPAAASPAMPWLEQHHDPGATAVPVQPCTAASPWLESLREAPKAAAPEAVAAPPPATVEPSEASEPSEPAEEPAKQLADKPTAESPLAFDPAEEAELAKGLLKVVLR
jgi:hypothetical protein